MESGENDIWTNIDLPTEIRTPEAFVIGMKKILVAPERDFATGNVKYVIDGPSKYLKVEGKTVLTASGTDGGLVYECGCGLHVRGEVEQFRLNLIR